MKRLIGSQMQFLVVLFAMLLGLGLTVWLSSFWDGLPMIIVWLGTVVALIALFIIFNRRTHHKIDLLRRQIETSSAFSQEITTYLDFSSLLNQITTLIKNQFHYDYVALVILNDNRQVTHVAQVGSQQQTIVIGQILDSQTPMGAAASKRQRIGINNGVANTPDVRAKLLPTMRSELALPLIIGHKFIGVLNIQSQNPHGFDADHVLVLQSLAAQTAVTIRNANLYEREANRRQLAETLYDVGLALSGTLDRQEVLDLVLEQLATIVSYDRASLLIHRHNQMEIVAARGFPPESNPLQIRIPLHNSYEEDVYLQIHRSKRPLVLPDISQQANWTHVDGLPPAKSWLGTPLIHGEQVIGMLSLVRETDNPYSQDDVAPATTFAVQAAVALENANLYNEIARFNHQLEYEIQQRTEAVLQLARLDQAKSDFINIAAHELRTPLTTLKGYSQMLLQDDHIANSEYHRTIVNSLYQGTVRLHEIVNNLLNVARIENETLTLHAQPISLTLLLQRIYRDVQPTIAERKLTLTLENVNKLPEVTADLDSLHTVFSHLVANAIKYTPDGGAITISGQKATLDNQVEGIEIIISDTGIGIDPEVQELIFTKFYQLGKVEYHSSGKTKFKGGGPGLGLAIVRGIVEAHGGRVWAKSLGQDEQTYPGSQFHVLLPLQPLLNET